MSTLLLWLRRLTGGLAIAMVAALFVQAWAAGEPVFRARRVTQRLGVPEGLPDREIFSLTLGPDRALWIGTHDGLARFNGTELDAASYRRAAPGSAIQVAFDGFDRLWMTGRRGLTWLPDPPAPGLPSESMLKRGECPILTADGRHNIWVCGFDGVFCHDGSIVYRIAIEPNWEQGANLVVCPAAQGGIYTVGDDGRIGHITPAGVAACTTPPPHWPGPNPQWWMVSEDDRGRLWLSWTVDYQGYLHVWDQGKWIDAGAAIRPGTWARVFARGHDGTWLIGTEQGGITEFGAQPDVFFHHPISEHDPITAIVADRSGTWWVGTTKSGVLKVPAVRGEALASQIAEPCLAVGQAEDGRILAGSAMVGGLMEGRGGTLVPSPFAEGIREMTRVYAILSTRSGLWVAGLGDVQCLKDGKWQPIAGMAECIGQESITSLAEAPDGSVWACGSAGLILRIDPASGQWAKIDAGQGLGWISDAEFSGSKLWINIGSTIMELDTGHPESSVKRWSSIVEARCLLADAKNRVLIGTRDDGLIVIDGPNITAFNARRGLNSGAINQLVFDHNQGLWMGTIDGLIRVPFSEVERALDDPDFLLVPEYRGVSTGLECATCSWGSSSTAACLEDGRVAFTTVAGVTIVDPAERLPATPPPDVHVRSVEVDGEFELIPANRPLTFHAPKILRIAFESIALESVSPTVFRWRLEPEASAWSTLESGRSITVVQPPEGTHIFRLEGRGADGQWHQAAPMHFEVLPVWWRTNLFRWLAGVLLVGLPILALQFRHRSVERRRQFLLAATQKLHAERSRISRDLHDELGNRLSEIHLLTEGLEGESPAGARRFQTRLKRRAIEAIASLDQIVWLLNPRHDSWTSLARMLEREGSDYLELAGIDLEFVRPEVSTTLPPDPIVRRAVLLAHREMLHNVVENSGATRATVTLVVEKDKLTLEVVDDGRGFDVDEALSEGRGLAGLRQRTGEFNGSLTATSAPGRTSVKVSFSLSGPASAPDFPKASHHPEIRPTLS